MEEQNRRGKNIKWFLGGVVACGAVMALLYFLALLLPLGSAPSEPDSLQALKKIHEIEKLVEDYYLGDVDEQQMTDYMFLGLVAGLGDRYSTYYTEEEYEQIQRSQNGEYEGIGITLAQRTEDGKLQVVECTEDSPADRAGVQAGDLIESINGTDTEGMTSSQAVELISQSESDEITMSLYREETEETLEVSIVKETVEMQSVNSRMLENQVGYIQITEFTGVTASQFQPAYEELTAQGMQKLVIDLRGNPGGLVDSVCDTLSQILPEGVIVYTEDKNGNRSERDCAGESPIDIPLAVLVNEESASASEIFAGAVKDYGIGTIVGTTTYGKGVVQNTFRLSDGSVIRLTIAHYYTPEGNDINGVGITPDVEVEQSEDSETDVQLEKALEVLAAQE